MSVILNIFVRTKHFLRTSEPAAEDAQTIQYLFTIAGQNKVESGSSDKDVSNAAYKMRHYFDKREKNGNVFYQEKNSN